MPDQEITETPKTNTLPIDYVDTSPKHIDIDKIYYYRSIKGLSMQEIADLLGCVKSTIYYHCQQHNIQLPEDHKHFENITTVKLKSKVGMLTDNLTHDKAQKARVTELTTGIGTLLDKIANLEGKAGLIVEVVSAMDRAKEIEALDAMYEELSNQ